MWKLYIISLTHFEMVEKNLDSKLEVTDDGILHICDIKNFYQQLDKAVLEVSMFDGLKSFFCISYSMSFYFLFYH